MAIKKMRIYGKFEHDENDWIFLNLEKISTKPFTRGCCMYLDIEEGKRYDCNTLIEDDIPEYWRMYNGKITSWEYIYNPTTKEYFNSPIVYDEEEDTCKLEDGRIVHLNEGFSRGWHMITTYKDGKPIGEPEFEKVE